MPENTSFIDYIRFLRDWLDLPREAKEAIRRDKQGNIGSDPGLMPTVSGAVAWLCRSLYLVSANEW